MITVVLGGRELCLDWTTLATLQEDGEVTCPNCGSWTDLDTLRQLGGHCELCTVKEEEVKWATEATS